MTFILSNVSILAAVIFFLAPIFYRKAKKQPVNVVMVAKCAIGAMAMPDFIVCVFYLLTDPSKAFAMPEAPQYFLIAVVIFGYLICVEIQKTLSLGEKNS